MAKTLEEIMAADRLAVYKVCQHCEKPLKHGDKFIDVTHGVCGSSQGQPENFYKNTESQRFHVECYITNQS